MRLNIWEKLKNKNMCFRKTNYTDKPILAEKNITCFKVFTKEGNKLSSPVRSATWREGVRKNLKLWYEHEMGNSNSTVSKGFHSFVNISDAVRYFILPKKEYILKICTIPKGSYYYNNGIEYCSNSLIVENLPSINVNRLYSTNKLKRK